VDQRHWTNPFYQWMLEPTAYFRGDLQALIVNDFDNGPNTFLVKFRGWDPSQGTVAQEQRAVIAPRSVKLLH
jgi:hypothetical protein